MAPSSYAENYIDYLNNRADQKSRAAEPAIKYKKEEVEAPQRSQRRKNGLKLAPDSVERSIITGSLLVRSIIALILIGCVMVLTVWMSAKATEIQYSINTLNKENVALEDQITMLGIQIDSAVSFESVEEYATSNLKMKYPTSNQCIYIAEDAQVDANLASVIRQKAYNE